MAGKRRLALSISLFIPPTNLVSPSIIKYKNSNKMSVYDILFRVDSICKKYEKYDIEKQRDQNAFSEDAFAHLYSTFDSQIDLALKKSKFAAYETDRATVVALYAEVRRIKARLMDEVPKLRKLAQRKVVFFVLAFLF